MLVLRGAEVLDVPAAFTSQSGDDRRELLLRAVENEAFAVPAQWERKADGRWTWGRSMIVDPWGTVFARCSDRDGCVHATIGLGYLQTSRGRFQALTNRRPEMYRR